ncbi:MAG: FAD:protein transferase [Pedosphaera sp.]|nr:FAD:protein transferase [Pedosphaera sp.]
MATRFEIVLHGTNPVSLRAAGEEALDEIERLEAQLSLYRPTSEIARVNALAAKEAVRVTPPVFRLLQQAQGLHRETGGAFDITIAPLVRCWGFMGGTGQMPEAGELAEARARVGMQWVELNEEDFTVRFAREGMMLDLGAIGKGYALERAAGLLREAGITSALLNGGTSSVYALGKPPDAECWRVAVECPPQAKPDAEVPYSITVPLCDEAMSVSAVWGRSFEAGGKAFGHVLDPRNGLPVEGALLSVVVLSSATETDALSTALLVSGEAGYERMAGLRAGMRSLVMSGSASGDGLRIVRRGIDWLRAG